MTDTAVSTQDGMPNGVMCTPYPDSIGRNLADIVHMLKRPEFKDVFSLFYILPTVFNSGLDRGFSIIDHDLDNALDRGTNGPLLLWIRELPEPMRLRNESPAFEGELHIHDTDEHRLHPSWKNHDCVATPNADLHDYGFSVTRKVAGCAEYVTSYR